MGIGKSAKRTLNKMKLKSVFTFAAVSGLLFASCADSYEGAPKKTEGSQQATQVVPVAVTKSNTMQVYAHICLGLRRPHPTLRTKESGVITGQ